MIIETSSGIVKGIQLNGAIVFRGIPYGAPPTGKLRFRPPELPKRWLGVRICDSFGPIACQKPDPLNHMSELLQSEDCLNLNVWTSGARGELRPVMVYIHGGGFMTGNGAECDGYRYAAEDGIVYISINYRLGALGFLYLGDLLGNSYETSGNNGMLDIMAALRWVQTNVANFGGDPQRVTVIGNSAGAKCTSTLYTMPAAEGLFQRAIAQSGATQAIRDPKTANVTSLRLLASLDLLPKEADQLLDLPAEKLIEAQINIGPDTSRNLHMFGPVADGIVIPFDPMVSLAERTTLPPLLIGTNENEAAIFTHNDPLLQVPAKSTLQWLFGLNSPIIWASYEYYASTTSTAEAWDRALSEHLYTIGATQLAEVLTAVGGQVWMYRLTYGGSLGAIHGYENCLIHHSVDAKESAEASEDPYDVAAEGRTLAYGMRSAWTAFIHAGDPNVPQLPTWPIYGGKHSIMLLDLDSSVHEDLPSPQGLDCPHQVWRAES